MAPLFSVLITSFNQVRFLRGAIHSVLDQTLGDLELLIADDGSSDRTGELVAEIQHEHPGRIELLRHPGSRNLGLVQTYALGLSRCRGELVAFLEPDDRWSRKYLETKAEVFRMHPEVDVVFSPYRVLREGRWGMEMSLRQWILQRRLEKERSFDNFKNLLRKNNIATFSCFAVRRAAALRLPELANENSLFLDWWMLLMLSAQGDFYMSTRSYTVWRQHPGSTVRRCSFAEHQREVIGFYGDAFRYLLSNVDLLSQSQREQLLREYQKLSLFTSFYGEPSLRRLFAFFRQDPVWALDSAASYAINSRKFAT